MMDDLELTLLYDKPCLPQYKGGWGLSFWIKYRNTHILFDSGWNGEILLENIRTAKLPLRDLRYIFLSHIHWDHIGGIVHILSQKLPNLEAVIIPNSFSKHFKKELSYSARLLEIPVSKTPNEITTGIWSSGVVGEDIKEHSLFLQLTNEQILIIAGCSHPSPTQFLQSARTLGSVYGILGGLHGFKEIEKLKGLEMILPVHCTKKQTEILSTFPKISILMKVGEKLQIPRM